jgi:hypothetical protein
VNKSWMTGESPVPDAALPELAAVVGEAGPNRESQAKSHPATSHPWCRRQEHRLCFVAAISRVLISLLSAGNFNTVTHFHHSQQDGLIFRN